MCKMKGITTLSIPSRNPGESPLVRCDNMVVARKVYAISIIHFMLFDCLHDDLVDKSRRISLTRSLS